MTYYAHPTAIVDEGAVIGDESKVWHYSHISSQAVIGQRCSLGQNVYVADRVTVGNGVKIQNNVSVYEGVVLEDDVFCGPSMVFTNVRTPRSAFPRNQSSDFYQTVVQQGASIGANATVVCGVTIGRWSMVAAGAVITRNVPPHALYAGVPARQTGWVCECGKRLEFQSGHSTCHECGRRYRLEQDQVTKLTEAL